MANQEFDFTGARARCRKFRKRILDISQSVGALHIAPAFSCLELVDTVYFGLMRRTGDPERDDTFILSKGHGSLAQFVALEELGVISPDKLDHYCKPGWPLATHPDYGIPGIEASTGSLGHGLGLAVGMAYAVKMNRKDRDIYVVMSDGELMEGSVWEALMAAPSFGITRIVALVDLNDFQSLGFNEDEEGKRVIDGIENWLGGASGLIRPRAWTTGLGLGPPAASFSASMMAWAAWMKASATAG